MFKTRRMFPCWNEGAMNEYCWAITQVAGRSCCGRSGSSVLELGLQLDSLIYSYTGGHVCTQFRPAQNRLEPDHPGRTIASVGERVQILTLSTVFYLRSPSALFPLRLPIECLHFVSLHFSSHPIFVDIIAVTITLCEKYKL